MCPPQKCKDQFVKNEPCHKTKDFYLCDVSATYYQFTLFEPKDLEDYLNSGLWDGKAGGCMVEGFCKKYIAEVQGYESTAMGLNTNILQKLL